MTHADLIHTLDEKYIADPKICPNEGKKITSKAGWASDAHGAMQVHPSGSHLICGLCGQVYPIGN